FLPKYQVNSAIMKLAKRDAIFMHCLPAKRGQEVTSDIIDGVQSVVWSEGEDNKFREAHATDPCRYGDYFSDSWNHPSGEYRNRAIFLKPPFSLTEFSFTYSDALSKS